MLIRLGNVLYWLGCILGAAIIAMGAFVWNAGWNGREMALLACLVVAIVVWAIGRAFRYILAGT
jgi:hypothetical protein